MPKLMVVKHSLPDIIPTLPARQWRLSSAGRQRCKPLADKLASHQLDVIVASVEPKAAETGQIVGDLLGKACQTAKGLNEHERSDVGWFESKERFEAAVAEFFARPRQLVFGGESADQAHQRFSQAIARVMERHPDQNVAVVSHGTVMTLCGAGGGAGAVSFLEAAGLARVRRVVLATA